MAYAYDIGELWRQLANYTDLVLKGTKPGELPIYQATKYNFIVNLKTAKGLGLEIPPTLLARADEVIANTALCRLLADTVAKVENRTPPKISCPRPRECLFPGANRFGGSLDLTHFDCQQAKVRLIIRPDHFRRYQRISRSLSSLGQYHAASVSPGGDLVRRTFFVVSCNRKMRVIVAE